IGLVESAGVLCPPIAPEVYQKISRFDSLLLSVLVKFYCPLLTSKAECSEVHIGQYFRASVASCLLQFACYRAHATDRYLPFAVLVTDQMVDETTILQQRWIVRMGQDADLCIGENKTAHQIVLQIPLDRGAKRFLHQTAPGLARHVVGIEATPKFIFGYQRLQHRVPYFL